MAKKPSGSLDMPYWRQTTGDRGVVSYNEIPDAGEDADIVSARIKHRLSMDYNPFLNTSSYVQVQHEDRELALIAEGHKVNLADQTIYTHAYQMQYETLSMLARLWHCPEPKSGEIFAGSNTVGSTEACLLAGLALKFR